MTDEEAARLREVLIEHGSVFGAGMCHHCGVARCETWVVAYDRLAAAGRSMVESYPLADTTPEGNR
ncbi:hypothetical protein [Krasilnikovia cinnamomea]|nr:hypothetical protein [Krasilnikovia cinnamomea]